MTRTTLVFVPLLLLADSAPAQEKNVPYLTPEQAVQKMTVAPGFEVRVSAAEPEIAQPIAFCFDDKGRMWVAENLNYRTRGHHTAEPASRITILEDADGDGRFERAKRFADRLPFLSALAVGMGGVWIGAPPYLLFLPDADGDDRPDGTPRVLLDGWGIDDRHETLNSFVWGPDGWLYGCHGVFTHSNVGKPGAPNDQRQKLNGGIFRYHPTKQRFEVFAHGLSNPWGLDFDAHGQAFATACVIPHLWHIVQGGYYQRQAGQHFNVHVYDDIKTITDHSHASAHGGARFYLADAFPAPYRGRLFMCNIHQHAVLTDVLERQGSSFVGRHGDEILKANDPQWIGFSLEIGPEGAVYILDWHDQDICGNAVHYGRTGRVYRLFPRDGKPVRPPDLRALSDEELVKLQRHPNDWYVRQARGLLQARAAARKLGPNVHSQLRAMLHSETASAGRLKALWALHVTGGWTEAALTALLDHADEYVRAWSVQLLCEDLKPSAAALKRFATMASGDPSPVVRLYLAASLQRLAPGARWPIVEGLLKRAEDAEDRNLPLMIWYGFEPLVPGEPARALKIAAAGKIPRLREFVSRRMAGGRGRAEEDDDR
ncbi:MAG: PVC-type heme-binding CxxCH protein [Planctomycetota bacterium]